jgi:hypothetical protein
LTSSTLLRRVVARLPEDGLPRSLLRELKVPASAHLARRRAERVARADGLIVVGPWHSEVGFELLYWVPYVRALLRAHGVPRERVVALSRGSTEDWYRDIAGRYFDLFELAAPDRLHTEQARNRARSGGQKQTAPTAFDAACVAEVRRRLGGAAVNVLHPALMYRRYRPVWMHRRSPSIFRRELTFAPIRTSPLPPAGLEVGGYVVVKAYFSTSFPSTDANVHALRELLATLARETEVVLLRSPPDIDDHVDIAVPGLRVIDGGPLEANLRQQAGVVAGAGALVSTYGGFSYLGPLMGIPTCAFYSSDNWNSVHLELMRLAIDVLRAQAPDRAIDYMLFDIHHVKLMDLLRGHDGS